MSRSKPLKTFLTVSGGICCALSLLILALFLLAPKRSAVITEASTIFTTTRATRSRDPNWRHVKNRYVSVEYENKTASGIRVRRQPNEKMPGVGDVITVVIFPLVREYAPARALTQVVVLAVYGGGFLVAARRIGAEGREPGK